MHSRSLNIIASAAVLTLLGGSLAACHKATSTGPGYMAAAQEAPAELTFQQDGQNFVLVNGDVFTVSSTGEREFAAKLYDPDFFAKNYTLIDGQVFQVDPDSGQQFAVTRQFEEAFENATPVTDLITPSRWHNYNTDPARAGKPDNYYNLGNRITVSRTIARSGGAARFNAKPSSKTVSKASLVKNIMYFKKGDHFYFSGWFYLAPTPSIYDGGGFTLIDLESSFMQSVGLRVIFRANDALAFELELPKTQYNQNAGAEVRFPTGRWVNIKTHALLSDENGILEIWQDGQKVLDKQGRTLPLADTVYDRIEVGISAMAKGAKYEKILYVDDVVISDTPIP